MINQEEVMNFIRVHMKKGCSLYSVKNEERVNIKWVCKDCKEEVEIKWKKF